MWAVINLGGHQPYALRRDDGLMLQVMRNGKLVTRRWSSKLLARKLANAMNYVETH